MLFRASTCNCQEGDRTFTTRGRKICMYAQEVHFVINNIWTGHYNLRDLLFGYQSASFSHPPNPVHHIYYSKPFLNSLTTLFSSLSKPWSILWNQKIPVRPVTRTLQPHLQKPMFRESQMKMAQWSQERQMGTPSQQPLHPCLSQNLVQQQPSSQTPSRRKSYTWTSITSTRRWRKGAVTC